MNNKYIKPEKDISTLLSDENSTRLSEIVAKSKELQVLNTLLKQNLEAPLRDHCIVANFRDGTLVIAADSGAWSTQLRYLCPTLLEPLRKHKEFSSLCRIEFYVSPKDKVQRKDDNSGRLQPLNDQTVELLNQTADGIDDPDLHKALKKLAKR